MQFRPKRNNKNAVVTSLFLLAAGAVMIISQALGLGLKAVNQFLIIAFFTAFLYVIIRFILSDFVYHLTDDGFLEVLKITSGIPRTLASVKICAGDCMEKVPQKRGGSREIKRKERFTLTMYTKDLYRYCFTMNGVRMAIILECGPDSRDFIAAVNQALRKAEKEGITR